MRSAVGAASVKGRRSLGAVAVVPAHPVAVAGKGLRAVHDAVYLRRGAQTNQAKAQFRLLTQDWLDQLAQVLFEQIDSMGAYLRWYR